MASSIRRNTFVIQNAPDQTLETPTGITSQNIMRLKINRIALVKELRVEHVIGKLTNAGVIDLQDVNKINSGSTPQDRARILLDLLPTKNRKTEWYKHFRESLRNSDASPETRRRYKLLVNFLDNTIIHRPTSQVSRFRDTCSHWGQQHTDNEQKLTVKLPHYSRLPEITHIVSSDDYAKINDNIKNDDELVTDTEKDYTQVHSDSHHEMTFVQGLFHQWVPTPENFRSLLHISLSHKERLLNSKDPEDHALMTREELALDKLRRVEVIGALARQKRLPAGFEICLCDAMQDVLNQSELYHLYLKHFVTLEEAGVMLVTEICNSYDRVLQTIDSSSVSETGKQIVQMGLKLASLLVAVNKFSDAAVVLESLIHFLKQSHKLEIWLPQYLAHIKLMHACNSACKPDKAETAYFEAVQMQYQITMMSFGQNVVYDGALDAEISHMMLEHGSIGSAFGWSRKALKEIDPQDPSSVVRVLCVAVSAYCAQWQVKKAELLAVYVVQYARKNFEERHPMFIEALLSFCNFTNEFKQDLIGLQASKDLLDVAEKTFGCESLQVAQAHCAISKALMYLNMLDTDDYYTHAMEAVRISRAVLGQYSPLLHQFLHTFACALQLRASHCPKEVFDSTLLLAESEAKQALALVTETFGEISLKSAQMLLLLGQIYCKMSKLDDAERCFKQAEDYLKLCQPSSSNFLLLGMISLASFYKVILKPELAVPRLQFVVDNVESTGWYVKRIHTCFEDLAQLYHSLGQDEKAEAVHVKLSHWLRTNPTKNKPIDYSVLKQEPAEFKTFVARADIWATVLQKAIAVPVEVAVPAIGEEDVKCS